MIYLKLFLSFFKIGIVSFGGGYAMIPLMRDTVLQNQWLTDDEILNFIGISESTPGPIAINMATFIGSSQGGILGSLVSTLGVILPSFIIILLIASLLRNLMKYQGVEAFLSGVRPTIVALILSTAIQMGIKSLFGIATISNELNIDIRGIILLALLIIIGVLYKRIWKKKASPILIILIAAILGMILYNPNIITI